MGQDPTLGPLKHPEARDLIRQIVKEGDLDFSGHARKEMEKDNLTTIDCMNVLRGGNIELVEYINGEWRYRLITSQMAFVVAFVSETELRVITGWRND